MKATTVIALLIAFWSPLSVAAAADGKIPVRDALALATALRNLDGHMVIIKQNGADAAIMVPWEFGSGALRLRIAGNLAALAAVERTAEESRQAIVRELLKRAGERMPGGPPVTELRAGMPEFEEYNRQHAEVLEAPAAGLDKLARIKGSELKLDRNEIAVTVLTALRPILDSD